MWGKKPFTCGLLISSFIHFAMNMKVPPLILEIFVQGKHRSNQLMFLTVFPKCFSIIEISLTTQFFRKMCEVLGSQRRVRYYQSLNLRNAQSRDGFKNEGKTKPRGTWVDRSDKPPTLDLGSGGDLRVRRLRLALGSPLSSESA